MDESSGICLAIGIASVAGGIFCKWLNALLCNGIVGGGLYLGLFLNVMVKCFKQCDSDQTHPFVPAVGLCVLGYITHNMFCYQQICAAGLVFPLMGLAAQHMRTGGKE